MTGFKGLVILSLMTTLAYGLPGDAPRLKLPEKFGSYHGLIQENEKIVEVKPIIQATGTEICDFKIMSHHHGEPPFQIILSDEDNGIAELRAKHLLNCEKRKNYRFDIAAVGCNGRNSENATVHISVVDVNEYSPVFLEPSYVRQVDEGKLYEQIIRVEATDRDCTAKFGDICKYEILTTDQPFMIDSDEGSISIQWLVKQIRGLETGCMDVIFDAGVIKNTEPLDYEKSHNHILSVVAYDCGMKRSTPVMVTIKVGRVCKSGWKGIPERIDYAPGSARQELFPEASLELCDVSCAIKNVETKLQLSTSHIGKGCDRDTYSVHSQRKICGADSKSIDLLPVPGMGAEWTKPLPTDEGHDGDPVFEFDGRSTAVIAPKDLVPQNPQDNFTLSVWVKHGAHLEQDKRTKEHIVCSADDHKTNRHHFALFVRNCRLILLLRKEHIDGDLNTFRPAEWRWKVPQVCDDEWHHFAVSMSFPDVQLYIDGSPLKQDDKNPEVIDDWPLHPAKGISTTFSIGACWQSSESRFKHNFKGYLAGLSLLVGKTEDAHVLSCLHKCKESLEVPGIEVVQPGMQLMTNTEMTSITVEGENHTDIENLVRKVGYINTREFPTPGRRNLHLSTKINCASGKSIKVMPTDSYVMVLPPQKPTIVINGTSNMPRDYEDFRLGVRVFSNVRITISSDREDNEEWRNGEPVSVIERKLDACTVSVYPPLNPDHESLTVPETMLSQLGIIEKLSTDGILLTGADMIYNYEQVLRQIQYTNKKPAYYLNRAFKLLCSELNGRFTSNEYEQTLTVIHPDLTKSTSEPYMDNEIEQDGDSKADTHAYMEGLSAHAQVAEHHAELRPAHMVNDMYITPNFIESTHKLGAGHAVTVIIVVCVAFLLCMIVLGVIRVRAAHQRNQQEELADAEMAWDDSALNITVNPMDNIGARRKESSMSCSSHGGQDGDESWNDDDGFSDHDAPSETSTDDEDDGMGNHVMVVPSTKNAAPVPSYMTAPSNPPPVPSRAKPPQKELEWDHSSM